MQTNSNYVSEQVQINENKGRFIGEMVLSDILKNFNYNVTSTPIRCSVDLKGSISTTKGSLDFQVEVKQRNKSEQQLMLYGNYAELRVDKYERMLKESPKGTTLLYMVLLNEETAYVFNLSTIDWNKVEVFNWRIKKTQVDPYSPYATYPTFKIPVDLAVRKCNCNEYFKLWN